MKTAVGTGAQLVTPAGRGIEEGRVAGRRSQRKRGRRTWIVAMTLSHEHRSYPAAPLLSASLCCFLLFSNHVSAFNVNVGCARAAAGRRGLDRCLRREFDSGGSSSSSSSSDGGISLSRRRARGEGVVVMRAGGGSAWSWTQATATALAALQIAATGAPAVAAVLDSRSAGPGPVAATMVLADSDSATGGEGGSTATVATAPKAARGTFEETWNLSNQFYFDKTHKGNDWNEVKSRLSAEIAAGKKSENAATKEMLALLKDKYSRLVGPEVYDMLSKYDLIGVGVMLSPNPSGQLVVASPPKAKSQAEKLGVKKGDLISSINGLNAVNMDSFEVTDYLAKYQGKTITFELRSAEDGSETRSVQLDRTFPSTENPVVYKVKDQGEHKIGYARLRDFNSIVANSLKDALVDMKAQGADEFVLDLRGNGGGAFQSALGVAGLFMDAKPITYVVDGSGQRAEFMTKKDGVATEEPLVVWVDGGSASSSEVLAGALQDDCRAVLRGERTFGKGLVQAVYGLEDGQGLILTVAQYETPRGTYIHGRGLTPDIRGGLPLKMVSTTFDFDQEQFDAARQKMKACPPMESGRLDFKGAAGTSSPPPSSPSL